MIVCSCKAVSDRTVGALVESGARTVEDVARATGAGTDCGCCAGELARILAERTAPCPEPACAGCPRRSQGR
jgi:bacterioferritin-associated ferredoxin